MRAAETADLAQIVELTASVRSRLALWSPIYFRPRVDADEAHAGWLGLLVSSPDHVTNVLIDGDTVIGFWQEVVQPSHAWVDDLCVRDSATWRTAAATVDRSELSTKRAASRRIHLVPCRLTLLLQAPSWRLTTMATTRLGHRASNHPCMTLEARRVLSTSLVGQTQPKLSTWLSLRRLHAVTPNSLLFRKATAAFDASLPTAVSERRSICSLAVEHPSSRD